MVQKYYGIISPTRVTTLHVGVKGVSKKSRKKIAGGSGIRDRKER